MGEDVGEGDPPGRTGGLGSWLERVLAVGQSLSRLMLGLAAAGVFLIAVLFFLDSVHDEALVVEAFRVPPELEKQGLTGEVVASKLLDQINALQRDTNSTRAALGASGDWEGDIKLVIPETGTTVGEVRRLLRTWLGRETRISGELVAAGGRLQLTARVEGEPAVVVPAAAGDAKAAPTDYVNSLVSQAAVGIMRLTQPYRYATHLRSVARRSVYASPEVRKQAVQNALTAASSLALNGPPAERPWGFLAWGNMLEAMDYPATEVIAKIEAGANLLPDQPGPHSNIAEQYLINLSEPEAALAHYRMASQRLGFGGVVSEQFRESLRAAYPAAIERLRGNFAAASRGYEKAVRTAPGTYWEVHIDKAWESYLANHDLTAARRLRHLHGGKPASVQLEEAAAALRKELGITGKTVPAAVLLRKHAVPAKEAAVRRLARSIASARYDRLREAAVAGEWAIVRDELGPAEAECRAIITLLADAPRLPIRIETTFLPAYANMHVALGQPDKAQALIDLALRDPRAAGSYEAKLAQGRIASLRKDWSAADRHFAAALRQAPSIPFADAAWGQSLLRRGDTAGAIGRYEAAHRRGPGWADPLKLLGDALLRQGKAEAAVRTYRTAGRLAPRWGALHIDWARALRRAGQPEEARRKLVLAAEMDLGRADRERLRLVHRSLP